MLSRSGSHHGATLKCIYAVPVLRPTQGASRLVDIQVKGPTNWNHLRDREVVENFRSSSGQRENDRGQ